MKCFVINLDSATKRFAHWTEQWNKWGGGEYERFSAIDGTSQATDFRSEWVGKLARCKQWFQNGLFLTNPEIGCAASHLAIYEQIVENEMPYAAIFEDDMVFCFNVSETFSLLCPLLNPRIPQVVLLSTGQQECEFSLTPINNVKCAGGYVITLAAAKRLLSLNTPLSNPIDNWDRWRMMGVKLLKCEPRVCGHWARAQFGSMLDGEQDGRKELKFKFWYWTFRFLDRIWVRAYYYLVGRR